MSSEKFNIPKEIRDKATKCPHDFACLCGEEDCLCELLQDAGNPLMFVRTPKNQTWPYLQPFGYVSYCTCPVRQQIGLRYRR